MRNDQTTRPMSKSPLRIARTARRIAERALPRYSSKYSPQRFTQAQLFACLVVRQFFRTDYRGLVALLEDFPELRQALKLKRLPHYSTLCYAQHRLTRHISRYYVERQGKRSGRRRFPKLSLVTEAKSHLIAGAHISLGPSQDSPQLRPTLKEAASHRRFDRLLADAAYDAEHNHVLARQTLGIRSTVIPINRPNHGRKWPKTRYRRQMRKRFFKRVYRQRAQVESVISRHKRLLGAILRARTWRTQKQECRLRILTHNVMILRPA
jgi:Transposase DDE domain